jgi:glycosyltransferase involved in cell wall biosynthesis
LSTVALLPEPPAAPARVLPRFVREVAEEAAAIRFEPVRLLPPPAPDAVVLLSVIRNEAAILGDFLDHYRRIGVDRFVVLDNGSTDGTTERLAAEPDVDLRIVRRRFLPPFKQGWINRAIAEYGHDRWYTYADADEHIVFDGCEDGGAEGGLRGLITHATARGLRRVRGMLVDMYAPGPIVGPLLGTGHRRAPLAEAFPLFDSDSYRETFCKQRISRQGGPRWRRFWRDGIAPELTKYPLFHIRDGEIFDNPHHLYPYGGNFESPCLVGILHFKFGEGFLAKIEDALMHEQYFDGSAEYKHYRRVLAIDPRLGLDYPGSRYYRSPVDLVACGLIERIRGAGVRLPNPRLNGASEFKTSARPT